MADKYTGGTLLDITQKYQDNDIFPLVVTEGESQNKLDFINENNYLQYCYNKLSEISGVLFIHGHSLNETDQHIFDVINDNLNIHEIYISIHHKSGETIDKKSKLAEKRFCRDKKLHYYDADSTYIWRK